MIVLNCHKSPLGLPNGTLLEPGTRTRVKAWASVSNHRTVRRWIGAGLLVVIEEAGDVQPETETAPPVDQKDEKDELIAKLAALGITKNRRSSLETLQAALAEATKAPE